MPKAKILVVDDEVSIVRALSMRLKSVGYEVLAAHNGSQAMQIAARQLPDLVILDIGMPCGNGHVVARKLVSDKKTLSIPIIFLTASLLMEDRMKAYETGIIAYLPKPFKSQDLLAVVSRALAASQQSRAGNAA